MCTGLGSRRLGGELHHLADLIDEKAVGLALVLEADRHLAAALGASGSPSRRRRQIAVTTRPRRLRSPTISRGASGTAVSDARDEHVVHPVDRQAEHLLGHRHGDVLVSPHGACRPRWNSRRSCHAASPRTGSGFGERRQEAAAVELRDELGDARACRARSMASGVDAGRERDHRQMRPKRGSRAQRLDELEAVLAGHLDIGDERVDRGAVCEERSASSAPAAATTR